MTFSTYITRLADEITEHCAEDGSHSATDVMFAAALSLSQSAGPEAAAEMAYALADYYAVQIPMMKWRGTV